MNLLEFINGPYRNEWIIEPGLKYYVKKWAPHPEIIILASVYSLEYMFGEDGKPVVGAYWRFIKRYSNTVPFIVEQVFNHKLALYFEQMKWPGYTISGVPQYCSPLAMELYGYSQYLNPYGSEEKPSDLMEKE